MSFKVDFFKSVRGDYPVAEFIESLTTKEQAKIARSIDLLEEFGILLGMPHVKKLEKDLWELRILFSGNIYRIFFTQKDKQTIMLLHGFKKKTQKTPAKELEIAQERLKRVKF